MKRPYLLITVIVSWSITLIFGGIMWSKYLQQALWGYLPLYFFGSLVFGAIGMSLFFRKHLPHHARWTTLSISAAVLLSMGFPPLPATFTMFIGFVPLLIVEYETSRAPFLKNSLKVSCYYAYLTFVLWNILTTWWVANTALIAGMFAIFANSALMLIPFTLFLYFKKFVGPRTAHWTLVVFWICFEYLHMRWEITWPWLTLGNALSTHVWLPQWYEFTGVFGGTLWIWFINILVFKAILFKINHGSWDRARWIWIILIIALPTGVSLYYYFTYTPTGQSSNFLIIQPNYEPHYEKFSIPEYLQAQRMSQLIEEGIDDSVDYVLLPETAFDHVHLDRVLEHPGIHLLKQTLQPYPKSKLILGVSAYRTWEEKPPGHKNLRISRRSENPFYWEAYNSAMQLEPFQVYHKSKLVPGPEIFPYKDYLFFFKPLIDQLDGTIEGLGTQSQRTNLESGGKSIAPVICYESIFGEFVTGYINNGAQAIAIMTNDGWWDKTPGHLQHLLIGRLRAIECRKDIARSANSGISGFIDQKGNMRQLSKYGEATQIRGQILLNDKSTFYSTWGDFIGRLALFIGGFQLLYLFFGMIKTRYRIR